MRRRLIVPYSPGGVSDNITCIEMPGLGKALKQTVVMDKSPGGAGSIGCDLVAKAAPDGYTLLSTDAPHTIDPHVLRKLAYDSLKDAGGDRPHRQSDGPPAATDHRAEYARGVHAYARDGVCALG